MADNEKGYVYILTNPSFREDWVKIGKSARAVNIRSKELDNTAVPLPFEIFATIETKKYTEVEKLVHKTIDRLTDLRIRQNRGLESPSESSSPSSPRASRSKSPPTTPSNTKDASTSSPLSPVPSCPKKNATAPELTKGLSTLHTRAKYLKSLGRNVKAEQPAPLFFTLTKTVSLLVDQHGASHSWGTISCNQEKENVQRMITEHSLLFAGSRRPLDSLAAGLRQLLFRGG